MSRLLAVLVPLLVLSAMASAHPLPTGHGPAGVMMGHIHEQGEWMIGYDYVYERWDGLMAGDNTIDVADALHAGYSMVPTSMTMEMHMLHLMYGVTDWFTLAVMGHYMSMDMEMVMQMGMGGMHMAMRQDGGQHMNGGAMGGGHMGGGHMGGGDMGGGDMSGGHMGGTHRMHMNMHVSGWGDTIIAGIFEINEDRHNQLLLAIGVSVPTGDVDIKKDGEFVGYGMQLGSGTWDLKPSLTYKYDRNLWQLGFQLAGTLRLEDENDSGYQLGNRIMVTGWTAYQVSEWTSLSLRLAWQRIGDLEGHYEGLTDPGTLLKDASNYGGSILRGGIGMNFVIPAVGMLPAQKIEIEVVAPLREDYDGIQLAREYSIHADWSISF